MKLQQLSVFVENRTGSIMDVTGILAENGINIRALSVADTTDFGVIRLIVDKTELAKEKLREAGLLVNIAPVVGVALPDVPGSFHTVVAALYEEGLMFEYSYAFVAPDQDGAYVILRIPEADKAIAALAARGFRLLRPEGRF